MREIRPSALMQGRELHDGSRLVQAPAYSTQIITDMKGAAPCPRRVCLMAFGKTCEYQSSQST
jgi:hypothetical protein